MRSVQEEVGSRAWRQAGSQVRDQAQGRVLDQAQGRVWRPVWNEVKDRA